MFMKNLVRYGFAAMFAWNAQATVVSYDISNLGAGTWQYDYSVANNTLSSPIEEFTIYFPLGLYSNLSSFYEPPNWSNLVAQPDPSLPADGFFDSLTLFAPILPGQTLTPFSVQFTWLGSGNPGSQFFGIVDPTSFTVLDSGNTIAYSPPLPGLPEPGTLPLAILGVAVLLQLSRHRGCSNLSLASTGRL